MSSISCSYSSGTSSFNRGIFFWNGLYNKLIMDPESNPMMRQAIHKMNKLEKNGFPDNGSLFGVKEVLIMVFSAFKELF
jgi:hypothetical protein